MTDYKVNVGCFADGHKEAGSNPSLRDNRIKRNIVSELNCIFRIIWGGNSKCEFGLTDIVILSLVERRLEKAECWWFESISLH
jgi:hypothetical protein